MGYSDNAIHRRADFVAHVGQEGAFRHIGGVGDFLGFDQFLGAFDHHRFELVAASSQQFGVSLVYFGEQAKYVLGKALAQIGASFHDDETVGDILAFSADDQKRNVAQVHVGFDDQRRLVGKQGAASVEIDFLEERL